MIPVLFTIGQQSISSFGLFLLLSFLLGGFTIWRLIRVYELNEEKVIDLVILSFILALVGARVYFILFHLKDFDSWEKMFFINRYPGLSFWGGVMSMLVALKIFSIRLKINFYQVADIGIVGVFIGLALSSIGCLLGSCEYGLVSDWPIAVTQIGLLGKRFPIQIISGFLYFLGFLYLWRQVLMFHFNGQVFAKGLMLLGTIKLFIELYLDDRQFFLPLLSAGQVFSVLTFIFGLYIYYLQSKKSFLQDIKYVLSLFYKPNRRKAFILKLTKSWYNLRVNLKFSFIRWRKSLVKILNIKSNPTKF